MIIKGCILNLIEKNYDGKLRTVVILRVGTYINKNQNNELEIIVEELETKLTANANQTFCILPKLDNQTDEDPQSDENFRTSILGENTSVNSQELANMIEFAKKTTTENEIIKKKNAELQSVVKELMNN